MTRSRGLGVFLRSLFFRRRRERDLDRELRLHLELEIESNLKAGMAPAEARRAALARFGGVEAVKEECREAGGTLLVESFFQDLRQGARGLRRNPGFATVAVLTLALGIGGTTAIFSVVHGILLRPLPLPEPDRLMIVWENDRVQGTHREGVSYPDYADIRGEARSFSELAVVRGNLSFTLRGLGTDGEPERIAAAQVSRSYFPLLGVEPVVGRGFAPEEEQAGRHRVAVLSHRMWTSRFGADPGVVGKGLLLDGETYTVVGVMPPEAVLPGDDEMLWVPVVPGEWQTLRGVHVFVVLGRLAPRVTVAEAQAEMDGVMARLEKDHYEDNRGRGAFVAPLADELVRDVRPALAVLLGAVVAVLLVACVNVASLLLARAAARGQEVAVRSSLGAGRLHLARQLLTESLLLAVLGGAAGLLLARWGVRLLVALAPGDVPRLDGVGLDGRVVAFAVLVALATWVVFAAVPAVAASRPRPAAALDGSRAGAGRDRQRLRRALVVAEVTLSVVLLVASGLLLRSFHRLQDVDPGYAPRHLLAASVQLPKAKYPFPQGWPVLDWPQGNRVAEEALDRLRALPGVDAAALALYGPTDGGWTTRVLVEGRPEPPLEQIEEAQYQPVGAGYFEVLGVRVLAGRGFTAADRPGAPLVAVVNQAFARRYFPDGESVEPVGEAIRVYGAARQIVGVVADVKFLGLAEEAQPTMYLPFAQNPQPRFTVVARTAGDPSALLPDLRALMSSLDPDLALFDVTLVEEALAGSLAQRRFTLVLLAVFAGVALLLAAIGIYGVVSYLVSQRTREIGVRMAVGATPGQVLWLVVGGGLPLVLTGLALGLAASLASSRFLSALLFRVGVADPVTFAAVGVAVALAALGACWWPARRAARIDPQAALRVG